VQIQLHVLGGTTTSSGVLNRRQEIAIALAGPATGVLASGAVYAAGAFSTSFAGTPFYRDALVVTFGWSLLNLVPILPLDGGLVAVTFLGNEVRGLWLSLAAGTVAALVSYSCGEHSYTLFFGVLALVNFLTLPAVSRVTRRFTQRFG
jgi:Zn-dependent protease